MKFILPPAVLKTVFRLTIILLLPAKMFAQPGNDLCAAATLLPTASTCTPLINQTLSQATATAGIPACGNATSGDVWYRFIATSAYPTISISNLGTGTPSITSYQVRLQLLSGGCGGLTSIVCGANGATSISNSGLAPLTIGTQYYVRVATNTAGIPPLGNFGFDICVVDPPANDDCAAAVDLTPGFPGTPVAGTVNYASVTNTPNPTCGGTVRYDVWYKFTAQSLRPTISLTGVGANFLANARIQLLSSSGTCGSVANIACTASGVLTYTPTANLTIGAVYYIRIYSTNLPLLQTNGDFNIQVNDGPPANDDCGGSVQLTSGTTCSPTTGSIYGATVSAVTNSCGAGSYDVWYHFTAQTTNPTVQLSSIGSAFTNASMEIYTGACNSLVSYACVSGNTWSPTGLTIGTTYRIRVYSNGGAVPASIANTGFQICVTDPAPDNDDCINAITLTSGTTCVTTPGNLKHASASAGVPSCSGNGNTGSADVWYSFVAQTAFPTISLSGIGADLRSTAANKGSGTMIQLLTGSCGAWTSVGCVTGTNTTLNMATTSNPGGGGLVAGTTYYVRISTNNNNANTSSGANWNFNICITDPAPSAAPRFGNSYVNLSKKNSGGVVEPGDTLEIRMTINLTSGVQYRPRYVDNIPTNTTMLSGSNDSIRVITNEGLTYARFTPGAGDDAATYIASPPAGEYNIRMNLGFGTGMPSPTAPLNNSETDITGAQQMHSGARPIGGGRLLFATSFRVVVTGNVGDTITLGAGKFIFRRTPTGTDTALTATPYKILISNPQSLCANATGVNSAQEFGGTFGTGTTLNRSTGLAFPIPGYTLVNASPTQAVGDGSYAIVKNTSPREGINRNALRRPNCTGLVPSQDSCFNRMFDGHWFIEGDHTGTNDAIGNAPPAPGVDAGYMLMVNADYVASETYRQTISGLCPDTYYEFSAWIRNICPNCGVDSTGTQTYRPGVNPNLTFVLDDIDRYSTGEVDTVGGWIKKGFVFTTRPGQTSATFSIRNNGQGGGGNDWVMDDISIATCLPNMTYTPTLNPTVCVNNPIVINNTIGSYFDNYRYHQWQRSTDNGVTWVDIGPIRDSVPVFNAGTNAWEYTTSYTVPPTQMSDSGNLYRVLVATSSANLANEDCRVTDGISFINLNVIDCGEVLTTNLLSFNGKLVGNRSRLLWTTSKEDGPVTYIVEKSLDGHSFQSIGTVLGYNNGASVNSYQLDDPQALEGKAWYRVVVTKAGSKSKMSSIIMLRLDMPDFGFGNVINPFSNSLRFDIVVKTNTQLVIELIDMNGKLVKREKQSAYSGINSLAITDTYGLPAGIYTLRVNNNGNLLTKRVLKTN